MAAVSRAVRFRECPLREFRLYKILRCYARYHWSIQQIDVGFSFGCPVIDHELRHNIVKVVSLTKFIVSNRIDALKTDVTLFFTIKKLSIFLLSLVDASH